MSAYRWREKHLDNQLLIELASDNPSEVRIRKLVRLGADLNSIKSDDSVLMDALSRTDNYFDTETGLDLRFIRLLVELGADVNYLSEEGDSPLMSACYTHRWEPVECILQLGANPNHIYDGDTTPLSWADSDQYYHEKIEPDKEVAANLERIVELLQQYGAKYIDDLFTDKLDHWLQIFALTPTGFLTIRGNIEIVSIQGVSEELAREFRLWHESNWDSWPDKNWDEMPKDFDRKKHNEWGRQLAHRLRHLVPRDVAIEYLFVDADDEARRIRNVKREKISTPAPSLAEGQGITILNDILSGKYGWDYKQIDVALDQAVAILEPLGLMEKHDALLNLAADYNTVALFKECGRDGENMEKRVKGQIEQMKK
jgi:hypothetical protein